MTSRHGKHRGFVAPGRVVLVCATVLAPLTVSASASRAATDTGSNTNWTTYHGDSLESGIGPSTTLPYLPTAAWRSPTLDGSLYGEPLVVGNLVVVATENDTVYALHAADGTVAWSTTVGTPVPSGALPCGNILPTVGITSTPVIDQARSEVFVVADEISGSTIAHHLVGVDLDSGKVRLDKVVDPAGSLPSAQLQRAALSLDDGAVLIGSGSNAGDCSTYHGWLVSVPETGGPLTTWEADSSPGNSQGAVWMGGAGPVVDSAGNVWIATGNGSNFTGTSPDGSDSVIELSRSLQVLQSFSPATWPSDNANDEDLGSSPPALLASGLVFQIGKSQTAYLLNASHLGGVGGQVSETPMCGADVDGGHAFEGNVVYTPCFKGVEAVYVDPTTQTAHELWMTSTQSSGPPIVVGGLVWTLSRGGTLYGLVESTGATATSLAVGTPANHFATPAFGDGLLLATASNQVVAFH